MCAARRKLYICDRGGSSAAVSAHTRANIAHSAHGVSVWRFTFSLHVGWIRSLAVSYTNSDRMFHACALARFAQRELPLWCLHLGINPAFFMIFTTLKLQGNRGCEQPYREAFLCGSSEFFNLLFTFTAWQWLQYVDLKRVQTVTLAGSCTVCWKVRWLNGLCTHNTNEQLHEIIVLICGLC